MRLRLGFAIRVPNTSGVLIFQHNRPEYNKKMSIRAVSKQGSDRAGIGKEVPQGWKVLSFLARGGPAPPVTARPGRATLVRTFRARSCKIDCRSLAEQI